MKIRYILPVFLLSFFLLPKSLYAEINSQVNVNVSGEGSNSVRVYNSSQSTSTNNSSSTTTTDITTTVNGVTKTFHSDKPGSVNVQTVNGETKIEVNGEDQTSQAHDIIVTPSVDKKESVEGVSSTRMIVQTSVNPDEFLVIEAGAVKVIKPAEPESSLIVSLFKKLFNL